MTDLDYQSPGPPPGDWPPGRQPLVMIATAVAAYVVGLGVFAAYVFGRFGQWIGGHDFGLVALCGMFCYVTGVIPLWTGLLAMARVELSYRGVGDGWRLLVYLLLPPIAAFAPTTGLMLLLGGGLADLLSAEAVAWLVLYGTAGVIYGAGWHWSYGARRGTRENEPD